MPALLRGLARRKVADGGGPHARAQGERGAEDDVVRADDALAEVAIPMLVRTGELDPVCPPAQAPRAQVAAMLRSVPSPTRVDHVIVPNAGHFSFQSPFPSALTGPAFAPSQDPPGFDRARYQAVLQDEIVAFVRRAITTTHVS